MSYVDPLAAGGALDPAHKALDRMSQAYDNRTGCYLTAKMIESLGLTLIGEMWSQERNPAPDAQA